MKRLDGWKKISGILIVCAATAIASPAQTAKTTQVTFNTLASFDGNNGAFPAFDTLAQGFDGNLYGTTLGASNIFKITPGGTVTTVAGIFGPEGCFPYAGVVLGTDGNFYGTAHECGAGFCRTGCGTVFKITPKGVATLLHSFCGEFCYTGNFGGEYPIEPLVLATDGNFYGTTGPIFKITPSGTFTSLNGMGSSRLVQGTDGNFYGVSGGGDYNLGTVFKMTPQGAVTTLHSFDGNDGAFPFGGLVQGADGNFYGTTLGSSFDQFYNNGTVFKITPAGALTTLHSFNGTDDGSDPEAPLVQGTDGNFYGTTAGSPGGGILFPQLSPNCVDNGCGTVFKITPQGEFTMLHSFQGPDGNAVIGGLMQATNGTFYGVTSGGGAYGYGTAFSLSVGLRPFVEPLLTSGKVGDVVEIMGNDLQGSTRVTFHGKEANFTVVSGTQIVALVPSGAKTGWIRVKTTHGMLVSNVVFRVVP